MRRSSLRGGALALATLAVVAGLDQLTKALVIGGIPLGEHRALILGIDLVHVRNSGVAFGFFAGSQPIWAILIAVVLCAMLTYFLVHADRPLLWLPVGMLLGGALGNVVDRVAHGAVTDFIKLPFWPAFNVADSAITIGVVLLVLIVDLGRARSRDHAGDAKPHGSG